MLPRPPSNNGRRLSELSSERPRSSWESSYSPLRPFQPPASRPSTTAGAMEPESSDSDVSVGGGDEYRFASPLTAPIPLPPPPSRHALESSDAIQARLDELARVEEHNIKKYELLKAKRARKDDKIRRKREIQDQKWAAIVEARQRRDARIDARRTREDTAFSQFFDHELEEEENSLRRRLKRLKRGLPPEESPKRATTKPASLSESPSASTLSTLPPPPKRHQVGPPGQPDSVNPVQSRSSPQSSLAAPSKSSIAPSPYSSYHRDSSATYARPFHITPVYSTTPNTVSPSGATNGLANTSQSSTERSHFSHLGRPASPLSRVSSTSQSATNPATPANPPRQIPSSYDTRPPPSTTPTGFTAIKTPSTTGFATINPRTTASSPLPKVGLPRPLGITDTLKTPNHSMGGDGMENTRFHAYQTPSAILAHPAGSNKRAPSTTHPYQMSEAFANRHHHCERVDSLNRGIWTSYGVGGTKDNPTGPPVEMYLRCNHDGCSRIDWRTVHGLQCHIVKNHLQPKGTIGSLDKALEKYGVPVKEVEDYERIHGRGSAGTMADPKNHKMKTKSSEASVASEDGGDRAPGSYVIDPEARPAGYRPSSTSTVDSAPVSEEAKTSPKPALQNGTQKDSASRVEEPKQSAVGPTPPVPPTPAGRSFSSSRWLNSYMLARETEAEPKRLQGDFGMSETQSRHDVDSRGVSSQQPINNGDHAPPDRADEATAPKSSPTATGEANPAPRTTSSPTASSVTLPSAKGSTDPPLDPAPEATALEARDQKQPAQDDGTTTENAIAPQSTDNQQGQAPSSAEQDAGKGADGNINGQSAGGKSEDIKVEELAQPDGAAQVESPSDPSETIVVDGQSGKEAPTRKKIPQSPSIANKSITTTTTTPTSVRRMSRRSSAARRSVDVDGDAGHGKDARATTTTVEEDGEDNEGKEEKEKDTVKPGPRRSMPGRSLRRGRV
ncbi:hypothetical protein ABEF93_000929 [Exophiala dermatitidis]